MKFLYTQLDETNENSIYRWCVDNDEFRSIRKRLGLTQSQLAGVLGYSRPLQVSEIEREKNPKPVPRAIALLMRAYDEGYRPREWPR
ncbi:helix-turn-helix domain-containing protein [Agrobacterium pusense]|uniref:helix-turn-helix domain-containing protein n=1 Tax=Agrobacterium pusense TaxID=648995 RepID=UPI0018EE50B0|nr:helix-turn-helix transcriptional regulator [Agrobacterium pusense]